MKKVIRMTEADLTKLVRRVIQEQKIKLPGTGEDPNTHRYDTGIDTPGFEKFLSSPNDPTITNGLLNQLRKDPFGRGKIVIIFNGQRFKDPQSFIGKIRINSDAGKCFTITDYEYNNRVALNTQITIKATIGDCKKATPPSTEKSQPVQSQPVQSQPVQSKPAPVKETCGVNLRVPGNNETGGIDFGNKEEIKKFQNWCVSKGKGYWMKSLGVERFQSCGTTGDDRPGVWSCCTATCWSQKGKEYMKDLGFGQKQPSIPPQRGGGSNLENMPGPGNPPNRNRPYYSVGIR